VKEALDRWTEASGINDDCLFRAINKSGKIWGQGMTPKVLWEIVKRAAKAAEIDKLAPHDLRRYTESRTMPNRSCRCCFGVEFAVNVIKGFGIV
jgi:integrase